MELAVAEIHQPFFEYRANFKEPIIIFWTAGRQAEIVNAVHKALAPWHLSLENITWNQTPRNASEVQLTFAVVSLLVTIQVGVGGVYVSGVNPDWSRTPHDYA